MACDRDVASRSPKWPRPWAFQTMDAIPSSWSYEAVDMRLKRSIISLLSRRATTIRDRAESV
jgi:hypothetical protein